LCHGGDRPVAPPHRCRVVDLVRRDTRGVPSCDLAESPSRLDEPDDAEPSLARPPKPAVAHRDALRGRLARHLGRPRTAHGRATRKGGTPCVAHTARAPTSDPMADRGAPHADRTTADRLTRLAALA